MKRKRKALLVVARCHFHCTLGNSVTRLTWYLEMYRRKKKKDFFQSGPLLPRHGVDPAVGKLDATFPCVMELAALLVIHLLKCFLLDHSPKKLWIPCPLVSTLLHASELQQGILVSRITPYTWQLSCSPSIVSRVSAPGLGEAQEASTSRRTSCCSPPAWPPGSWPHCHCRCAVLPSVFIWR